MDVTQPLGKVPLSNACQPMTLREKVVDVRNIIPQCKRRNSPITALGYVLRAPNRLDDLFFVDAEYVPLISVR